MFGTKKRKITLIEVEDMLSRRHISVEEKNGRLVVAGKYPNNGSDYRELVLSFKGKDQIQFQDPFGRKITHVPSRIPMGNVVREVMNVLNIMPTTAR